MAVRPSRNQLPTGRFRLAGAPPAGRKARATLKSRAVLPAPPMAILGERRSSRPGQHVSTSAVTQGRTSAAGKIPSTRHLPPH